MDRDDPRYVLKALAAARGESLAGLSRLIGRNAAYLQQFVERGSPRRLAEADRALLAAYIGVDESVLGAAERAGAPVRVPRLDIAASAGPGALVDDDRQSGAEAIDPAALRRLRVRAADLAIITARGDSMAPGISDGDELLVDGGDRDWRGGGVFVARLDGALVVKRLAPHADGVAVISDNPAYPELVAPTIDVVGRVVRLTRRMR